MASSERQSSQQPPVNTPYCQIRGCSHRLCPPQGCCRACPKIFWCPQCTRFWCANCWEGIPAHQPIEIEVPAMKEHEKMIPELVEGLKSSMVLERRSGMDDPRIGLQVTPQEQGIVPQERNAATTSPNQNTPDSSQIERPRLRSVAGIKLGRPLELHEIPAWYFEAGRVMVAIEEERNAQEKRRKASNATGPPPNSTVQIERGTSEPNQVLSESPESSGAARGHTFQNHHIQKLPPKQQTRKRSSVTRGERESVPKRHQSVVPNPSMPASVTRNDALQEDQMGLYRLDSERREMEQEGQGDTRAHAPKETGISAGSASQTERETSAQSQTVPPGSPQLNIS